MEELDQLIAGSFGSSDLIFALHPNDQQRAQRMIEVAISLSINRNELGGRIFDFLEKQNITPEHRTREMDSVNRWLDINFLS